MKLDFDPAPILKVIKINKMDFFKKNLFQDTHEYVKKNTFLNLKMDFNGS